MKNVTRRGFLIGGSVAAAAAGVGLNGAAAYFNNVITRWWSGTFTKPTTTDGSAVDADTAKAASKKLSIQIESEGAVLLKNNGLLLSV